MGKKEVKIDFIPLHVIAESRIVEFNETMILDVNDVPIQVLFDIKTSKTVKKILKKLDVKVEGGYVYMKDILDSIRKKNAIEGQESPMYNIQ